MPDLLVVAKIELLVEYDGPGDDAPLMDRVRAESEAAELETEVQE